MNSNYRWWALNGGRESNYRWLKIGPVSLVWGRYLFLHSGLAIEILFLNRLIWCNY
jgi:hypothetical protein